MANHLFILGAGASASSGAPVMSNFIDKAQDLYDSGQFGAKAAEIEPAFELLTELNGVYAKSGLDLTNLENVLGVLEMARLTGKLGRHKPSEIDAFYRAIILLITKTIEQSVRFHTDSGPGGQSVIQPTGDYGEFVELLLDIKEAGDTVAVITFNYDLCLDFALTAYGQRIDYGLRGELVRGIKLYKLHGSLNWAESVESHEVVPLQLKAFTLTEPGVDAVTLGSPDYTNVVVTGNKVQKGRFSDLPVIVPPTWNKGAYQSNLRMVWSAAATELSNARFIYVMGYSLPSSDAFFRYLYALGTMGSTRLHRLCVIDPSESVLESYKNLISPQLSSKLVLKQCYLYDALADRKDWAPIARKWTPSQDVYDRITGARQR